VKIASAISGSEAKVELFVELQNTSAIDRIARISVDIISPRGETIAKLHHPERQVPAWEERVTVDLTTDIRKPTLWNIGDGQLYSAIVHVYEGDIVVHKTPACLFGLRTVEFQQDGILVNGIRHKIRGCNIHADFAGVGVGMPDRLIEYKLELLREMGANAVRIAHHPPTPELVQHADRMGLFVIPENRSLSTAHLGFLRTLVRLFRNSTSILLWSLENEELTLQGTVTGMAILKRLVAEVKRLDPSRHTCVGGVIHLDHAYHDIPSVIGIHYQGLVNTVEKVTSYFPNKPHIQDECGLHAPTRCVYTTQPGRNSEFSTISGLMPSFANMTKIPALGSGDLKARDNISTILTDVFLDSTTTGGCIWTGMDYHGEPVPTAWPSVISAYGARDLIGLPKDYYWLVRCIFRRDEPLVHAFPHRTWPGKEEERIPFRVYSNCHSVQVQVNGQTVVEKRAVKKSTAYFPEGILYTPGELLVRGLDAAGAVVAEHRVRTAGRPYRLVLQSDRSKLAPNGDVSTIELLS
jgi:beta-galactosidase